MHDTGGDDMKMKNVKLNSGISSSSCCSISSTSTVREMVKQTKVKEITRELASKKHALSERKRRRRINCHYDSLRHFFPRILKSDKASVLAETVRHLKELKKMVADLAPSDHDGDKQSFFIPGENDEMSVGYVASGNKTAVRAIVCCEDRPGLNQDLTEAIHSVRGKAVKAEMATIGGRTKAEVVVELREEDDVGLLRRALKAVVENRVLGRTGLISHGYTEPGFGRRYVDGERPICDQIENRLADGLIVRSSEQNTSKE
ncbi:unnamed protein product [Lactuca saligna]|uniref:BHLH domain-containing protein n=1 Tax=Lactuca saligna TaxID=75948 RepID=A0AA35VNM8_LACSI|nr:unnamed protein product [Lactuca saligna]